MRDNNHRLIIITITDIFRKEERNSERVNHFYKPVHEILSKGLDI